MEELVAHGRYPSATDVVRDGLVLIEQREAKLRALRETLEAAIAEGGAWTDEEVGASLTKKYEELKTRGF